MESFRFVPHGEFGFISFLSEGVSFTKVITREQGAELLDSLSFSLGKNMEKKEPS